MYYLQRFGDRYVHPVKGFPTLYHLQQPQPFGHTLLDVCLTTSA